MGFFSADSFMIKTFGILNVLLDKNMVSVVFDPILETKNMFDECSKLSS